MSSFFAKENRKNLWITIGAATAVVLGLVMIRRRRRNAANASSSSSKNSLFKGLVVMPVDNLWGTRPITQWSPNATSCRTYVPITDRTSDALVAVAVVEEQQASSSIATTEEKDIILALLRDRNNNAAAGNSNSTTSTSTFVSQYNIDSLKPFSAVVPPSQSKQQAKSHQQPAPFSFVVNGTGSLHSNSAASSYLISVVCFIAFNKETNSLLELVIDTSILTTNEQQVKLAQSVSLSSVIDNQSATLVSTVPSSAVKVTLPVASWKFTNGGEDLVSLLASSNDASKKLSLVDSGKKIQDQIEELSIVAKKNIVVSKMTEDEVLAAPKCATTVVHKQLGVEFPAVSGATILEPRYSGTNTLACLVTSPRTEKMMSMTFELWTSAPEQWFTSTSQTREEIDRHFLRETRMLFLPITVQTSVGPNIVSICGHEGVGMMESEMDGRHVRLFVFRRPAIPYSVIIGSNNNNSGNNNGSREILVIRQEADADSWKEEAVPFFRKMMESCLIAR